jgi:hypothetical protein
MDVQAALASPAPLYPALDRETLTLKRIEAELRKVIVGQEYLLDRLLVGPAATSSSRAFPASPRRSP